MSTGISSIRLRYTESRERRAWMTIRLILGAIIGGGVGLLINLVSTKIAKGSFT